MKRLQVGCRSPSSLLSFPLFFFYLAPSLCLCGEMMDRKWLAFPDSHVETGFSLRPSAGLHGWSDDSGNTERGLNRVRDGWVKCVCVCAGGCVYTCVCVIVSFPVAALPKPEHHSVCSYHSTQGWNPSGSGLKSHLSLSYHSFYDSQPSLHSSLHPRRYFLISMSFPPYIKAMASFLTLYPSFWGDFPKPLALKLSCFSTVVCLWKLWTCVAKGGETMTSKHLFFNLREIINFFKKHFPLIGYDIVLQ